jgi:glycosyltransferase involved in cell wall biosynthesis
MFVKNSFEYDARVTKEAKSLIDAGHHVTVVALLSPKVTPERETTADGIAVIRVPRASLGVPTLNRIAARYAGTIEARHSRLTGEPVDREKLNELGRLSEPSTVAPEDTPTPVAAVEAPVPATQWSQRWARTTTPVLRGFAASARWTFRNTKKLLGTQSSRVRVWAIDRRMVDAGLSVGADVFHAHDLNTLGVAVTCKEGTPGSLLVYDSHELQTERSRMTPEARETAIAEEGAGLPHAEAMIVASPSWIGWNRDLYGAVPDPSITVLNVPELAEVEPSDALREALGIDAGDRIVVYQGSIQENRGIEPAIEAVRELDRVVLVVIGYGYYRPALEAYVESEGLTDRVKFFGPIPNDELLDYTASGDVGLCNIVNASVSYYTSLPNKLFEYAMAGLPVVGSDSPEIGRVVTEEGIGEVCDPIDPDALAGAITTILDDPTRYDDGLVAATKKYNWGIEQHKLTDLYEQLAARFN